MIRSVECLAQVVSYLAASGPRAGIVVGEDVFDVTSLTGKPAYTSVLDALNDWGAAKDAITGALSKNHGAPASPLSKAKLTAPVLYPSSIYCAGANYSDHQQEMERLQNLPHEPDPHTLGLSPWHFLKTSRSITGPNAAIKVPSYSKMLDREAELVAVIGETAKDVPLERALDHVAGYTIANDLSARDAMKRPGVSSSSPFQFDWIAQKCFDQACPVGPWITPAEQVGDPQALGIKLWVNDVLKQDSHTSRMIFSTAEQVSHLSTRMTLYPGDLILTGTPSGVGIARGESLKAGDVVKVWIENIGTLVNELRA